MNMQTTRPLEPGRIGAAIDNLRSIVVLLVIAVHAALAYATYAMRTPVAFDSPPFAWRTFPVIDPHSFLGFDIFCAWADVFLMPLFFLVSGLFVWRSLERNGARSFALRRILRLAPPFVLGVAVIMPIAIWPAYAQRTAHPQLLDYLHQLRALPFWPDGPMWFLFVLLTFDLLLAASFAAFPRLRARALNLGALAARDPMRFLAGFFALSAVAYIPLGTLFGPMRWFQWGPFSFQLNFIALYAVFFGAGVVIGMAGPERGLLHPRFARAWKRWMLAAAVLFVGWLLVSAKAFTDPNAGTGWMLADAIVLVPACFASCLGTLLLTLQFGRIQSRLLQSLRNNAFAMYWVHYAIVTWLQFALLAAPLPAIVKALIVFSMAAALSWTSALGIRQVPILNGLLAGARREKRARVMTPVHSPMLSD